MFKFNIKFSQIDLTQNKLIFFELPFDSCGPMKMDPSSRLTCIFSPDMENLNLPHPRKLEIAVPANLRCGRPEDEREHAAPSWGPVVTSYAGVPQIEAEWVLQHLDVVHVLDVRSPEEFSGSDLGRIDGAHGDKNLVCTCPPLEDLVEEG